MYSIDTQLFPLLLFPSENLHNLEHMMKLVSRVNDELVDRKRKIFERKKCFSSHRTTGKFEIREKRISLPRC